MKKGQLGIIIVMILFVLPLPGFSAQYCDSRIPRSSPDSRFILTGGIAEDTATKLVWKRCSEGRTWQEKKQTCIGSATHYAWKAALKMAEKHQFGGDADWRVPTIAELQSIVELACYLPSINKKIFPATLNAWFWSSSSYANDAGDAWFMGFQYNHYHYHGARTSELRVRLVRGGGR